MGIVPGVVAELQSRGLTNTFSHRRWHDPLPGLSVIVVTSETTWTHGPTSAQYPLVKVLIYSAPSADQADAEQIGEPVAAAVRRALHWLDSHERYFGTERVIASQHVGASLHEVEGRPEWRLRTLSFEVQTA